MDNLGVEVNGARQQKDILDERGLYPSGDVRGHQAYHLAVMIQGMLELTWTITRENIYGTWKADINHQGREKIMNYLRERQKGDVVHLASERPGLLASL